jgi:glycosyltransferase involved in cell wall biosynthesis
MNNMSETNKNIEKLADALSRIDNNESVVYFLCYDTKGNARAAIKHIYDLALITKQNGFNSKILVEEKNYTGVSAWLGDRYKDLDIVTIKEDKIEIKIEDILVVPEYYSNVLQQLANIRCVKLMLLQQKEYMFETLPIGSRWSDYGFEKVVATTNKAKEYVMEYFPESLVYVVPPIIDDIFVPSEKPLKPYIAISCRDRLQHRKLISEFYLKYPQLRWITFRDMVQMSYDEFADSLKECFVSVWMDSESTFGTFPLESMKCGVPVIGKIPDTEPDWLGDNGMWSYDSNKIVEILGTYCLAWLEGAEVNDEVKEKMRETLLPYNKEITTQNTLGIFESLRNKRRESITSALEKLKTTEETV